MSDPVPGVFTSPAALPTMPWRDPATATDGTLWGRVTDAQTGDPIDNATVYILHIPAVVTDGNGYFVMTRLPAVAAGSPFDVTASASGYASQVHADVSVVAGDVRRVDFSLSSPCSDQLITGFEGFAVGSEAMFRTPRYSGSTDTYLALTPNISQVTDEVAAFAGTQCAKLSWAFVDAGLDRWLRATTSKTANVPNPTIDLARPVRVPQRF